MGAEGRLVDVATGARLWTVTKGSGPTVVLIHGNFSSLDVWAEQIAPMAKRFTVVAYDVRGFGRSPLVAGRHSDRADLRALLEALGIERAHLVGLSMGCGIALGCALEYASSVKSLVITPGGMSEEEEPAWMTAGWQALEAAIAASDYIGARELIMGFPPMQSMARYPSAKKRMEAIFDAHQWAESWEKWSDYDWLRPGAMDRLSEVSAPTLVVQGDLEDAAFLAEGERLADQAPHVERVIIPGVGHQLNMERHAEYNEVVTAFIERVEVVHQFWIAGVGC